MKTETQLFLSTLVGILISTSFLFVSFIAGDPTIYEIPLGLLVAGQLIWLGYYVNGFTKEYLEEFKKRKHSVLERFAQVYGFFVIILIFFGLIEFWWYIIVAWILSLGMVTLKALVIAKEEFDG